MVINLITNPSNNSEQSPPLILTLKLDPKAFQLFDQLRQQHFPSERNILPAHITLFHQLPGEQQATIQALLSDRCATTPPIPLTFPHLRSLGHGVAVEVEAPELLQLRRSLAEQWQAWLGRQDQQRYRPHITIQNKVTVEQAQELFMQLQSNWHSIKGHGAGLLLWQYLGGPWRLVEEFSFKKDGDPRLLY